MSASIGELRNREGQGAWVVETSRYEHGDGCEENRATDEQVHVKQGIHRWGTDNLQQTQIEFAGNLEAKTI